MASVNSQSAVESPQASLCLSNWERASLITLGGQRQQYQRTELAEIGTLDEYLHGRVDGDGNGNSSDEKLFYERWDGSIGSDGDMS